MCEQKRGDGQETAVEPTAAGGEGSLPAGTGKRGGTKERWRLTNNQMLALIRVIPAELKGAYGSPRRVRELRARDFPTSKDRRYEVTTDSKHGHVANEEPLFLAEYAFPLAPLEHAGCRFPIDARPTLAIRTIACRLFFGSRGRSYGPLMQEPTPIGHTSANPGALSPLCGRIPR